MSSPTTANNISDNEDSVSGKLEDSSLVTPVTVNDDLDNNDNLEPSDEANSELEFPSSINIPEGDNDYYQLEECESGEAFDGTVPINEYNTTDSSDPADVQLNLDSLNLEADQNQEAIVIDEPCHLSDEWKRKDHIFVFSQAGKPIYSRYGDETQLASLMGVMQALVSFVAASGDELYAINTVDRKMVFLQQPPLILVAIGPVGENKGQLLLCLRYVYHQILSSLTQNKLQELFSKHQNVDLRRWLAGHERLISPMVTSVQTNFGPMLESIPSLPMASSSRDAIGQLVVKQFGKLKSVVFACLLYRDMLVTLVKQAKHRLPASDFHLLANMTVNSQSLQSASLHWLPICLPAFNPNKFLYTLVAYNQDENVVDGLPQLGRDLCLVVLSTEKLQVYALKEAADAFYKKLKEGKSNSLFADLVHTKSFPPPLELRHLLVKHSGQHTSTDWSVLPYFQPTSLASRCTSPERLPPIVELDSADLRVEVGRQYRRLHSCLHDNRQPGRHVYRRTLTALYFAWKKDSFEIYCTLDPLTPLTELSRIRQALYKWVEERRSDLFICFAPTLH